MLMNTKNFGSKNYVQGPCPECSSSDAYTEWKIQEALDKLLEDRTSIVIAHRLTTIKNSDRIIVLDKGEIVEEGNHESLMDKGGLYSELYETYFKHQSAEWISEISEVFTD